MRQGAATHLADAVCARLCLQIDLRVPVRVVHDDRVGGLQVQTHATCGTETSKDLMTAD